jgi:radical SAM protein with 4Fe4S-binding SPASM domain
VVTGLARKLAGALSQDLGGLARRLSGPLPPPEPGLRTFRVQAHGGKTRLHLRIGPDGEGVLFVDVSDVLHLSQSAARMALAVLEGADEPAALDRLRGWYPEVPRARLLGDLRQVTEIVRRLSDPRDGCRTCTLELSRTPLFRTRAKAPFKADLALTYACNNDCPHCYNPPDRVPLATLPTHRWRAVLDTLATVGVPHVIFTGGEATLHPELPALIAHAEGLGQLVGLNTNGRRIAHRPYMETLARAGLSHVQVTLDSHRAQVHDAMVGTHAFAQTVRGIESALQSGVHTLTNTTLTRRNVDEVEALVDFLHRLGLRAFAMNGMIYSGGGGGNPDAILEDRLAPVLVRVRDAAAERGMRFLWYTVTEYCRMSPVELELGAKRCNAGEYSICVEPDGSVLPCQSFYASAGNLLDHDWQAIWSGELFRSFRDREDDPAAAGLPEKCWDCLDLPLCGGGCRIEREARGQRAQGDCQGCAAGGCPGAEVNQRAKVASAGIPGTRLHLLRSTGASAREEEKCEC